MKCKCGSEMVWQGSIATGGLVCLTCYLAEDAREKLEEAITLHYGKAPVDPDGDDDLPEGLTRKGGVIYATCIRCDQQYELPCDVSEYHPDYSYCGGSPRCSP